MILKLTLVWNCYWFKSGELKCKFHEAEYNQFLDKVAEYSGVMMKIIG